MAALDAAPSARAALFDFLKPAAKTNSVGGSGLSLAAFSQDQMVSGLKEALAKGVQRSITNLGQDGGYLNNVNVKISKPEKLRSVERRSAPSVRAGSPMTLSAP